MSATSRTWATRTLKMRRFPATRSSSWNWSASGAVFRDAAEACAPGHRDGERLVGLWVRLLAGCGSLVWLWGNSQVGLERLVTLWELLF